MRLSQSFSHPLRNAPKEADTVNHRLLTQAGYVDQLMAGVYTYLPLGLRVLNKISQIVREEMNAIGGEELLMPLLHPSEIWKQSGGWDTVDILFKLQSQTSKEYALASSEEEVITPLFLKRHQSYVGLENSRPYNIQWKFRDELRAKSGIMRGREFLMKDMYSYHATQEDFDRFYETAKRAYVKTFARLGLTAKVTEASGGNFTDKVSYEFEVLTDAGEDVIYYCNNCDFCVEDEIATVEPGETCPKCGKEALQEAKAAEVGNVFDLGTKYTEAFNLKVATSDGESIFPIMGCYGIGISRVMGVIVEKYHDQSGIVWPDAVAPYHVHLVSLGNDEDVQKAADTLYEQLRAAGVETLYDDRDERAGVKFADADLIGIPQRVTVSKKTLAEQAVELKTRTDGTETLLPLTSAVSTLAERGTKVDSPDASAHNHEAV